MLATVTEEFTTEANVTVEMPIPDNGKVKYFKAFVWDSNLTPIAKSPKLDNK